MTAHCIFHHLIILCTTKQNANTGILVRAFAVSVQSLQVESELSHVLWLKAPCLEFERDETLQITVIEKQIQFEILIAYLYTNLLTDKCKTVAKFVSAA